MSEQNVPQNTSPVSNRELSFGEKLVGLEFNPSGRWDVNEAKELCAKLANMVNDAQIPTTEAYLQNTFKGDAIRCILHAQMAVVKFLTFNK